MKKTLSHAAAVLLICVFNIGLVMTPAGAAARCAGPGAGGAGLGAWAHVNNGGAGGQATQIKPCAPGKPGAENAAATTNPYEYMARIACTRTGELGETQGAGVGCYSAVIACAHRQPPSQTPLTNVYRRLKGSNGAWQFVGQTCNPETIPGVVVPVAPTWGQIQTAFRQLPFAKPSVHIQPEHNVTLVNLPTYYAVDWPTTGLSAGAISQPVNLLGWTLRFRIAAHSYTYRYGDGTSSPATTDTGGPYPNGKIRHTYSTAGSASVRVDTQLTGDVSINGGAWEPIDTIADLQNEPSTALTIKSATNRLVR